MFRNLTIQDVGSAGIYANSTISSVTVSDCTITHCGDFGIHFHGTWNGVTISRVTASGFAGLHYPSHAIYLKGEVSGKNFTIQDCDLGNSYGPGGGVSAICVGYGVTNGQILRNKVHTSPWHLPVGTDRGAYHGDHLLGERRVEQLGGGLLRVRAQYPGYLDL